MNEYSRMKLAISEGCNLNCRHCYLGDKSPVFMPTEMARKRIGEASSLGVKTLDITGGEPTMHPDFAEISEHAARQDFQHLNMSTNATLLEDPKILEAVLNNKINCHISLDGVSRETVDNIRGEGSYTRIMKIIDEMRSRGGLFSLRFSINQINKEEVPDMIKFAEEHGINIEMSPTQIVGNADQNLVLSNEDIVKIQALIKNIRSSREKIISIEESFLTPELCDGGESDIISVNVEGKAVSCLMVGPTHDFKPEDSLKDMWDKLRAEKEVLKNFRPKLEKCLNCDQSGLCSTGCNITAISQGCLIFNKEE